MRLLVSWTLELSTSKVIADGVVVVEVLVAVTIALVGFGGLVFVGDFARA